MNCAFKVIQGHPYWCRHKSRTAFRRNVQLMPTLFLKLRRYDNVKTADTSISTTPSWFEEVQKTQETPSNMPTKDLFPESMGLCLLLTTQLFLKVKRSESRRAGGKRILT